MVAARESGVRLPVLAQDFGISAATIDNWLRSQKIEPGELRELRKRNGLLEQEVKVLRRAAAYLSRAHLPGKALPEDFDVTGPARNNAEGRLQEC